MTLAPGSALGPYEIVALLGKGGMGEVYRARDTKLERDVAIKVLPEELATDSERLARFEREAKLLASLNHPNIASIYGFESGALVLELVDGPTLAERIAGGPIPVDETIAIALQIAAALEAGHEAGVIHRDLKPANIKLKEDGTVKVLDYGLAKAMETETPSGTNAELSQSPTLTRQGTQVGVILGTAAYMSPEQAKGKRVDRRADIWAFGAVLYEMLTGKRAFGGDDVSETLAAVIRAEPDFDALSGSTPAPLRLLVRLCLNKDATERIQSIGDARLMLKGAFDPTVPTTAAAEATPRTSPFILAAISAIVTGLGAWVALRPEPPPVMRLTVSTPPVAAPRLSNLSRDLAISPRGDWLVYKGTGGALHVRHIGSFEATRLDLLDPNDPFVSPDGSWIGFEAAGSLQKVPVQGGQPTTICPVGGVLRGASWSGDGTIVFATSVGLFRVAASGGEPTQLTEPDGVNEVRHVFPASLPGIDAVLFVIQRGDEAALEWDIASLSLETGERRVLVRGGTSPRYLESGHLAYVATDALVVVPFDAERLQTIGEPVVTIPGIRPKFSGVANFDVSNNGALIYQRGYGEGGNKNLVWVDRQGREEPIPAEPRPYRNVALSPDGQHIVMSFRSNIWIHDLTQGSLTRLTFSPSDDFWPTWTRDGERVLFGRRDRGHVALFWKAADGTGAAERLVGGRFTPFSTSPDGRKVVGHIDQTESSVDIAEVSLDGNGTSRPLIADPRVQWYPQISPSGRWIAYSSNESGREEIYVRPYPNVEDGRWQITTNGGQYPTWSPQEDEFFYRNYDQMLAVSVSVGEDGVFRFGTPSVLFEGSYDSGGARHYDVAADGRFLMMKDEASGEDYDPNEIHVVLNWFEELKRRVPSE